MIAAMIQVSDLNRMIRIQLECAGKLAITLEVLDEDLLTRRPICNHFIILVHESCKSIGVWESGRVLSADCSAHGVDITFKVMSNWKAERPRSRIWIQKFFYYKHLGRKLKSECIHELLFFIEVHCRKFMAWTGATLISHLLPLASCSGISEALGYLHSRF